MTQVKGSGHKFRHCCGFPFIETSLGGDDEGNSVLRVSIFPETWGGDPNEVDYFSADDHEYTDYDDINIICSRCGAHARMIYNDAHTPHSLGAINNEWTTRILCPDGKLHKDR